MKPSNLQLYRTYLYVGGQANLRISYLGMDGDKYAFVPVDKKDRPCGKRNSLGEKEVINLVIEIEE